jgi:predicted lipid-binding transport protein (Tim44 family)
MLWKNCLKGALVLFALLLLSSWAFQGDAWARAGGGGSMGSRGSRSSSPPRSYSPPSQPTRPSPTPGMNRPGMATPPMSQPSSFWRSFGGGMLGGLAGGMLFHSLFGGPSAYGGGYGGGGGGGIGLFDILLLAGIGYLIYWYIKKKRLEAASAAGYQTSGNVEVAYQQPTYPPVYDQAPPQLAGDADLERGLENIRQFDPNFDESKFGDMCMDTFFKIQGAWANRDMSSVRNILTEEMSGILQGDADRLRAAKKINRLENIAVRSVDITEAWQESGTDYITVRVYANLLDYNVDETSGQIVEGSKTEPVKFEEYWTFNRPVGNNPWKLSAIQQPA